MGPFLDVNLRGLFVWRLSRFQLDSAPFTATPSGKSILV